MKIISNIVELQNELFKHRKEKQTIGLVPTMGALHRGHASLVERCVAENGVTVVSIFVNPNQFNDPVDFQNYPITLEADCDMLSTLGVNYVFAPSVNDIYPTPDTREFSFPPVTEVMEGVHRPGHFNGVCQVVSRLFYIVKPVRAYFGEKDWQQIAVVKQLVRYINVPVTIVECPIVREESGLALSSRNTHLTTQEKEVASKIYAALASSISYAKSHSVEETHNKVVNEIEQEPLLQVEYYDIVDGNLLTTVHSWEESTHIVGCITVFCGAKKIRLIDHITYK